MEPLDEHVNDEQPADLRGQVERCVGMFRHLVSPGETLSEELILERRREAAREEDE